MLDEFLFIQGAVLTAFTLVQLVWVGEDVLLVLLWIVRLEITLWTLQLLQVHFRGFQTYGIHRKHISSLPVLFTHWLTSKMFQSYIGSQHYSGSKPGWAWRNTMNICMNVRYWIHYNCQVGNGMQAFLHLFKVSCLHQILEPTYIWYDCINFYSTLTQKQKTTLKVLLQFKKWNQLKNELYP